MKDVLTPIIILAIAVVLLLVTGIGATVFITPAYAPEPARLGQSSEPTPLTGVWHGNDGGTYYLRQIGDVVWWIGLNGGNDGRIYSNIFRGTITTQPVYSTVIEGEWVDVPRGAIMNSGKLLVDINEGRSSLSKISGAFGTTIWTKETTPDTKPPYSLTGVWQASDGGTYYLRQIGYNLLWWNGMSGGNDGRTFNNVFKGEITWWSYQDKGEIKYVPRISGEWIDVPRGTIMNSGTLDIRITGPTTLQMVSQTGGFGATTWQKIR
jgi:hypothetical protein